MRRLHCFISFVFLTVAAGCSSDAACTLDSECFAVEVCSAAGECVPDPGSTNNVTANNTTRNNTTSMTNANNTAGNNTTANNENNTAGNNTTTNNAVEPRFVQLIAGVEYTCGLEAAGTMMCWGENTMARLSVEASGVWAPPSPVQGVDSVDMMAGGARHRCALKTDGTVWCWGRNAGIDTAQMSTAIIREPTQMPISNIAHLEGGWFTTCAVGADPQELICFGDTEADTIPSFDSDIVDVAVGEDHTCVALASGQARCWGSNYYEQITESDPIAGITGVSKVTAGARHTCALADGDVYCWGWNDEGQGGSIPIDFQEKFTEPTLVEGVQGAVDVFAGETYTCALLDTGRLTCWGGLVGYEATVYSSGQYVNEPKTPFGLDSGMSAIGAGHIHTCGVKGQDVWCFGNNSYRQLGEGGENSRYEQPVKVQF